MGTLKIRLSLFFTFFSLLNLCAQWQPLAEEQLIIQPGDFIISSYGSEPIGYGKDILPRWNLTFREERPLEGIVKTISLKLSLPWDLPGSWYIAPLISTYKGEEMQLEKVRLAPGEQELTWSLPATIPMRKPDGRAALFIGGFRLYLSEGRAQDLRVEEIRYLSDKAALVQDPDHLGREWSYLAENAEVLPQKQRPSDLPVCVNTGQSIQSLISLFGDYPRLPLTPGFEAFKADLILSMWHRNPQDTLNFLLGLGDYLWYIMEPEELFPLIGYAYLPFFENMPYHLLSFDWGYHQLLSSEPQYIPVSREMNPWEYHALYRIYREEQRPMEGLILAMKDRAGILQTRRVETRSFTLEELLFQALLVQLGYLNDIKANPIGLTEAEMAGIPQMESLSINRALARILGGRGTAQDLETLKKIQSLPEVSRLGYALVLKNWEGTPQTAEALEIAEQSLEQYSTWMKEDGFPRVFDKKEELRNWSMMKEITGVEAAERGIENYWGERENWMVYQYPARSGDYWFSAQPLSIADTGEFHSVKRINLEVSGLNQDGTLCVLFKDSQGRSYEFPMGNTLFDGPRTLSFHLPYEIQLPPLQFQEIRLYRSNPVLQYPPDLSDLELRLGSLQIEGRSE